MNMVKKKKNSFRLCLDVLTALSTVLFDYTFDFSTCLSDFAERSIAVYYNGSLKI